MKFLRPRRLRTLTVKAHPRGQPHLSAASGLVCAHGRVYVMADDEHHLAVFGDLRSPGPDTYWNRDKQGNVVYASQIAASEGRHIPDVDSIRYGRSFDHTSIIATLLNFLKIDPSKWQLGSRTANAPTFEGVITRQTPRPLITVPNANPGCRPALTGTDAAVQALPDEEVQGLPISIMARAITKVARDNNAPDPQLRESLRMHFADVKTTSQLHQSARAIIGRIVPVAGE